ncbi:MAG: polyphosphate polymerase domain-containing protein [Candidatus Cryptobacteroides sp.]
MAGITLDEMDSIKLMNRVDTKYLTTLTTLGEILRRAVPYYRVLETAGSRVADYDTLYYDTDGYRMYLDHQNRRLDRRKIRTRTYLSSGDTFLEIKKKNNRGRTKKKRIAIPSGEFNSFAGDNAAEEFISSRTEFTASGISPSTRTEFSRITLVNNAKTERLTIDSGLRFENIRTGLNSGLADAVIIELKQEGHCHSDIRDILLDLRVKPVRVSKYCIGTVLTVPDIKKSRFIKKIRTIEKLTDNKLLAR